MRDSELLSKLNEYINDLESGEIDATALIIHIKNILKEQRTSDHGAANVARRVLGATAFSLLDEREDSADEEAMIRFYYALRGIYEELSATDGCEDYYESWNDRERDKKIQNEEKKS